MSSIQRSWLNIQFIFVFCFVFFLKVSIIHLTFSYRSFTLLIRQMRFISFRFILFCLRMRFFFVSSHHQLLSIWLCQQNEIKTSTGITRMVVGWRYECLIHFHINLHFGRRLKLLFYYFLYMYICGVAEKWYGRVSTTNASFNCQFWFVQLIDCNAFWVWFYCWISI